MVDVFHNFQCLATDNVLIAHDQFETNAKASSGKLIAGLSGRVVNGELQLRGPNVTPGYHKRPEANEELFVTDKEGKKWLRTGDIVRLDEDQNIWVTDRAKE